MTVPHRRASAAALSRRVLACLCASNALVGADARAAESKFFPKSDVILSCLENGQPRPVCTFICGGGYSLSFDGVSRVEIYTHGHPGRTDQRVWIAVEHVLGNPHNPNDRTVSYVFSTPINACNWDSARLAGGNSELRRELRIEKFDQ